MKLTGKEKFGVKQACADPVFLQWLASRVLRWFDMSIYLQKRNQGRAACIGFFLLKILNP